MGSLRSWTPYRWCLDRHAHEPPAVVHGRYTRGGSSTIHRGYYVHTLRWQCTGEAEEHSLAVFALAFGRFVTLNLGWNSMKC